MTLFDDLSKEALDLRPRSRNAVLALIDYLRSLGAEKGLTSYFLTTEFADSVDALIDVGAVIGSSLHLATLAPNSTVEGYSVALSSLGPVNVRSTSNGVTVGFGPDIGKGWTLRAAGSRGPRLLQFVQTLGG